MRLRPLVLACLIPLFATFSCSKPEKPELLVYAYDSFTAEWGAGPKIASLFEKATSIKTRFVSKGDGGQLLSALIAEKTDPEADIAIGIDNQLAPKAIAAEIFAAYSPKDENKIPSEFRFDPLSRLIPFDYGHFAIIWDSEKLKNPPSSLEELSKPEYAKKLILMDPRTSTPGLGFLAWTKAIYGEDWKAYWGRLKPSILTMTPGWDTGYGLFTSGEAPLVVSYATSPAYHKEYEKTERYKALAFAQGHPIQIEAAGIVKGARHRKNAELFMDFLISVECQAELPLTQWMMPIRPEAALPESFSAALKGIKSIGIEPQGLSEAADSAAEILASK